MRVICLVPSLTEALIECGVQVVGRTRFCIHPAGKVKIIARIGGTKEVDWQKCRALRPDIVIFDREENLKQMAVECPFPWHATHITSVNNVGAELRGLGLKLNNHALQQLGDRWDLLAAKPSLDKLDWSHVPGQLKSLSRQQACYKRVEYIVWRHPWMAVSRHTFIGSMLEKLGFSEYLNPHQQAYPVLADEAMADPDTFYLFSSEPYPFARHQQALLDSGFNGAIVDGEVYSWFGIRSFHHLHKYLTEKSI